MQVPVPISLLALLTWAFLCARIDARERRIPNTLVLAGLLGGALFLLMFHRSFTGATPVAAFIGLAFALLLTLPGYALKRLGAGDVKMLAVVGLATDLAFVAYTIVGAALALVLWALLAPSHWQRLPAAFRLNCSALAPPLSKVPYAPFLFCGMCLATALRLTS